MYTDKRAIGDKIKEPKKDFYSVVKAVNILFAHWQINDEQRIKLLGFTDDASLHQFENSPEKLTLNLEQQSRLSLLLNIHSGLRRLFTNPDNIYGFMSLVNHNPPFNGKTPFEIACHQRKGLYLVSNAIDGMVSGGW
jgi:hypothetical protein